LRVSRAQLLAISAVVMWSTAASAFKLSLRHGSPFQILFTATSVSLLVCLASVVRTHKGHGVPLSLNRKAIAGAALRGFLNPVVYYLVLLQAYDRLLAQTAMVINYLWPVVIVLLSIPILGQKIRLSAFGAVLLSFSGVAVMALFGGNGGGGIPSDLPAAGMAFFSTVIWSLYWLLNIRDALPGDQKLLLNLSFGIVYLSVFGILSGGFARFSIGVIAGGVYIGIFEMGLAYLLWMKSLTLASTTAEVGSLVCLTPFIALLLVGLIVGEKIGTSTIAGLLLVVAGILLQGRLQLSGQKKS
jgi:drug/metabolite transporter (DMT)-like permease